MTALAAALVELAAVVSGLPHERAAAARELALELADDDARSVRDAALDAVAPPLSVAEQAALVAELAEATAGAAKPAVRPDAVAAAALAAGAAAAAAELVAANVGAADARTAQAREHAAAAAAVAARLVRTGHVRDP